MKNKKRCKLNVKKPNNLSFKTQKNTNYDLFVNNLLNMS
jgi:hypothetical protein